MNNDELEVKFLRLLQEFTDIKLKRREQEQTFPADWTDESLRIPPAVSPFAPMLRLLNSEDERFLLQQGAPEATDSADLVREKR